MQSDVIQNAARKARAFARLTPAIGYYGSQLRRTLLEVQHRGD